MQLHIFDSFVMYFDDYFSMSDCLRKLDREGPFRDLGEQAVFQFGN